MTAAEIILVDTLMKAQAAGEGLTFSENVLAGLKAVLSKPRTEELSSSETYDANFTADKTGAGYSPEFAGQPRPATINWKARALDAEAKLNAPELHSFRDAVVLEAAHQRERWKNDHDAGKTAEDWLWLVAYLSTKAGQANRYGDHEKYLHHIITCAAACANWHAFASGEHTGMRPGSDPAKYETIVSPQATQSVKCPKCGSCDAILDSSGRCPNQWYHDSRSIPSTQAHTPEKP